MTTGAEDRVFSVPEEDLEFGGGADWYPIGDYEFTIQDVYPNPLGQTEDGEPFRGFMTTDGEQLSIQASNFIPLNGAPDPPSQLVSTFIRITIRDGDQDYVTVDPKDADFDQLAKGKRKLAAIAAAIGETPNDSFVNALRDGDLNGTHLAASFRKWTFPEQTDKSGTVIREKIEGSWPTKFWASATI